LKPFRIEQLAKQDRSHFDCGTEVLNEYLRKRAGQEQRKRFSTCYLAIENETDLVAGFYTLSSSSISLADLPPQLQKKLPRYQDVPVARIGRLAVGNGFQGKGLGSALVYDAIERVINSGIGIFAIVVDAKDDQAVDFYRHMGFELLLDEKGILYLSIASV